VLVVYRREATLFLGQLRRLVAAALALIRRAMPGVLAAAVVGRGTMFSAVRVRLVKVIPVDWGKGVLEIAAAVVAAREPWG